MGSSPHQEKKLVNKHLIGSTRQLQRTNFQGMVVLPQKKQVKKLRECLNDIYFHLDSAGGYVAGGEDLPTGLAGFRQGEYYPYVYYKMNIDMVGAQSSVLGS